MTDTLLISAALRAFGFELENTGGNCTAYVRREKGSGQIVEEIITLATDPAAPTRKADVCHVSDRDDSSEFGGTVTATVEDIIAALSNPSDDYYLLTLRLENGFHKRNRNAY